MATALLSQDAWADAKIRGPVAANILRVIDGDTVKVSVQIWIDQLVTTSVRVKGVDAAELFRPHCEGERERAHAAKAFLEERVGGDAVMLRGIDQDKYGGRMMPKPP